MPALKCGNNLDVNTANKTGNKNRKYSKYQKQQTCPENTGVFINVGSA
jgi:hypothetical protein